MVFPWVQFVFGRRLWWLSDILFLAVKDFKGKRVDIDTDTLAKSGTAESDIVTKTATAGKDMYLGKASVSFLGTGTGKTTQLFKLYFNGVVEETIYTEVNNTIDLIDFKTFGKKVAATQIIKITHQAGGTLPIEDLYAKLILWEETTGVDPFNDFR